MKKLFLVALAPLILWTSGCMYHTNARGVTVRVPAIQVGANVQVLDFCAYAQNSVIYASHGPALNGQEVLPGQAFWVALPTERGLDEYSVSLTYVSSTNGGSVSRSFPVNYNQGSQRFQWVLTRDTNRYSGGGSNVYIDWCP